MSNIRVLHCPTTTGGNPQGIARAEREIGLKSWSIAFRQNYFQYKTDEVFVGEKGGIFNQLTLERKRWQLLWRAVKDFDIVHFNFGMSIMPSRVIENTANQSQYSGILQFGYQFYAQLFELKDLPLLKRAGKGIVVTYQGDDARQGDFCQANFEINFANEVEPGYYSAASDEHKRYRIAKFSDYADRIFALNPDLLHVLPSHAQFLPYSHIDLRDWQVKEKYQVNNEVPVIIHAPSHRGVKGTRFVIDAVSRLQKEGVPLEFILVENLAHSEARQLYERADLLIDQLLAGWYGGLTVELMALGKPAICYIRQDDLKFIPQEMQRELPIINATPATIYEVLKQWLTIRKHELPEIGKRSRAYVEKWHDPLKIGNQMKREYDLILQSKKSRYMQ
ncbi:MAG: hypothetical protein RLZZ507_1976 [Cyanobacteriota bacterium]|jgi:hypothetical protein